MAPADPGDADQQPHDRQHLPLQHGSSVSFVPSVSSFFSTILRFPRTVPRPIEAVNLSDKEFRNSSDTATPVLDKTRQPAKGRHPMRRFQWLLLFFVSGLVMA